MDYISETAQAVADTCSTVSSLLVTILNANFVILSTLLNTVLSMSYTVLDLLKLTGHALLYAAEDFQEFICEIGGGIVALAIIIKDISYWLSSIIVFTSSSISNVVSKTGLSIHDTVSSFLALLVYICSLLRILVVLTAESVLMILQFLPQTIVLIASVIMSSSKFLLKGFVKWCNETTAGVIKTIKDVAILVINNIRNIPRDAYIGLIIIVITILLHRYMKHKILHALQIFKCWAVVLCLGIVQCYKYAYSFLLRCFRHLNAYAAFLLQRLPNLNNSDAYDDNQEDSDQDSAVDGVDSEDEFEDQACPSSSRLVRLKHQLEEQKGASMCVICLERAKNMIFLPCRHMCACQDCGLTLVAQRSTCPLCRHYIRNTIHVYT